MKIKNLLFLLLLFGLPGCETVSYKRKPQSAGFREYCANCILPADKDLKLLQDTIKKAHSGWGKPVIHKAGGGAKNKVLVRSVVVLDKDKKPLCRVDLLKHPDLVPDFATLHKKKFAYHTNKPARHPASLKKDLPDCEAKYLKTIRRAKQSRVLGASSYKHKTGYVTWAGSCLFGTVLSYFTPHHEALGTTTDMVAVGAAIVTGNKINQVVKEGVDTLAQKPIAHSIDVDNLKARIKAKVPSYKAALATSLGTFCYVGSEYLFFE